MRRTKISPVIDDEDLVAKLAAGGHDALSTLLERHGPSVLRMARRVLKDHGEAEDTVQQVFLDLFRSAGEFDRRRGAFKHWFWQFAYHRVLQRRDHLITKRFYSTQQLDLELEGSLRTKDGQRFRLASQELPHLVQELLATLRDPERRMIELRVLDGLSREQVAKETGNSLSVVRNGLHRGLRKLRSALKRNGAARKRDDDNVPQEDVPVSRSRRV